MKSQPLREVKLFVKIDDLSKKKHCDAKWKWVALWAMYKRSCDDLRVVFEEQSLQFQRVLRRCSWAIFATIFSENARLFQLFKASEEASIYKLTQTRKRRGKFFIDSTPLPVCKSVLHAPQPFRLMAQWAHSSVSTTFGAKLHIVADERQKIIRFTLKPGNLHDCYLRRKSAARA
jgi:hypothetical protein